MEVFSKLPFTIKFCELARQGNVAARARARKNGK
jgi:hypothetical protein